MFGIGKRLRSRSIMRQRWPKMNDFLKGISETAGAVYRKKAAATLGVFAGGGVFGVLCFVAGWVAHG